PASLDFTPPDAAVGEGSVARLDVPIKNCGTRTLLLDHLGFYSGDPATLNCDELTDASLLPDDCLSDQSTGEFVNAPFGCTNPIGVDPDHRFQTTAAAVEPGNTITVPVTFHPTDLDAHAINFAICGNDPVKERHPVVIPATGQGQACPTACFDFVDG